MKKLAILKPNNLVAHKIKIIFLSMNGKTIFTILMDIQVYINWLVTCKQHTLHWHWTNIITWFVKTFLIVLF